MCTPVGDPLEKCVINLFTNWLNQLTDTVIQHPDPAFSDTREFEGWQTKQCWIKYGKTSIFHNWFFKLSRVQPFDKKVLSYPWLEVLLSFEAV
jgi:hypothetical protein